MAGNVRKNNKDVKLFQSQVYQRFRKSRSQNHGRIALKDVEMTGMQTTR
jgi:hypothetical protein